MTKKAAYKKTLSDVTKLRKAMEAATQKPVKKAAKKAVIPNMYLTMLSVFKAAGVHFRTWALRTSPGLQDYDGHTIVVGSSGSEPYTTFCFDTTGKLRELTSVSTSDDQQVAVECIGKQTMTIITPFNEGSESRHITNPEEN